MNWLLNKCRDTGRRGTAAFHLLSLAVNCRSMLTWPRSTVGSGSPVCRNGAKDLSNLLFECSIPLVFKEGWLCVPVHRSVLSYSQFFPEGCLSVGRTLSRMLVLCPYKYPLKVFRSPFVMCHPHRHTHRCMWDPCVQHEESDGHLARPGL